MTIRFGRSTYRPQSHARTHVRTRTSQPAPTTGTTNHEPANHEPDIKDAINNGLQACYIELGTHHPMETFDYHDPVGGYTIIVSRATSPTAGTLATCAQYYGPYGHWMCYVGYTLGALFCLEPP